jgi:hypothetical protein
MFRHIATTLFFEDELLQEVVKALFFGGPNLGINQMFFPAGRSVYNSFQTSLRANVNNPFIGVKALNWQVSYALSRYLGSALDSDFVNTAVDNNHPVASLGPNGLDRTHQFSFGGSFDLLVQRCPGALGQPVGVPVHLSVDRGFAAADGARCANTGSNIAVNAGDYFQIQVTGQAGASAGSVRAAFEIVAASP